MKEPHMEDPVLYQNHDHAAQLTLNRPHIHNALDRDMTQALGAALERAVADPDARIIVLTGAGPTFCAGLNLKGDGGGFRAAGGEGDLSPFQAVVKTLWECPKPLIGRIQGSAFGAGFGLVACCDIAVAVDSAQFAVTELRVGLPPTLIALILQHKNLIGAARAMLLTGERFGAEAALRLSLVHEVTAPGALDAAVGAYCEQLLRCAPAAFAAAKEIQRTIPALTFGGGLHYVGGRLDEAMAAEEALEGKAAYLEKRAPRWVPVARKGR